MLKHRGKRRTYFHNLKLASLLSAVAGIVNITGVLELGTLTTNVTGHFAFFSEGMFFMHYGTAGIYLLYIFFFLFGAFVSTTAMEWETHHNPRSSYAFPVGIEIALILGVSFWGILPYHLSVSHKVIVGCILLCAMGLQNALVSRISQTVVRTTHLTGLFTDLGIELSQICFQRRHIDYPLVKKSIFLKLSIIGGFFMGGMIGASAYGFLALKTLLLPVGILSFALWYDRLMFRYHSLRRKFRHKV